MRIFKIILLLIAVSTFTSCASGYKMIEPKAVNYVSTHETDGVKLEYRYDLLNKKYRKKERKNGVKLVAVKITNESGRDITIGTDAKLVYGNGTEIFIMENQMVFETLKQQPATYLLYLLLTPLTLTQNRESSNVYGDQSSTSIPIGLILGPAIAGGNLLVSSSANKKFKAELLEYNINNTIIKQGETKYGLIGIGADSYDIIELKLE